MHDWHYDLYFLICWRKCLSNCSIIKSGDEEYKIEIAVAGFNKNDISIEVKKGLMTIEASKFKHSSEYLHRGIAERSFTK